MTILMPRFSAETGSVIGWVKKDKSKLVVNQDRKRAFFFFGKQSQDPDKRRYPDFNDDWFTEIVVAEDLATANSAVADAIRAKHWGRDPDLHMIDLYSCTLHSRRVRLVPDQKDSPRYWRALIVDEDELRPPVRRQVHEVWLYPDDMEIDIVELVRDVPQTIGKKPLNAKRLLDGIKQTRADLLL